MSETEKNAIVLFWQMVVESLEEARVTNSEFNIADWFECGSPRCALGYASQHPAANSFGLMAAVFSADNYNKHSAKLALDTIKFLKTLDEVKHYSVNIMEHSIAAMALIDAPYWVSDALMCGASSTKKDGVLKEWNTAAQAIDNIIEMVEEGYGWTIFLEDY